MRSRNNRTAQNVRTTIVPTRGAGSVFFYGRALGGRDAITGPGRNVQRLYPRPKRSDYQWSGRRGGLSGLGDFTAVADAIQTQEGYYPGSLSYNLNNPGNLIYAGQPGATPTTVNGTTWAQFSSYAAGFQALLNQIALDASRGLTISQFTAKYAPASDGNDPAAYANNLAAAVGLSPSSLLSSAGDSTAAAPAPTSTYDLGLPDLTGSVSDLTSSLSDLAGGDLTPWLLAGAGVLLLVWVLN